MFMRLVSLWWLFGVLVSGQRFYIEPLQSDKSNVYTGQEFRIGTDSLTLVNWSLPSSCSYQSENSISSSILVTCTTSGSLVIKMNTLSVPIQVKAHTGCYYWYAVSSSSPQFHQSLNVMDYPGTIYVRIWVVGYSNRSMTERNGTAIEPQGYSKEISTGFYSLGESPQIKSSSSMNQSTISFDSMGKYWTLQLSPTTRQSVQWSISGNGVALFGCWIESSIFRFEIGTVGMSPLTAVTLSELKNPSPKTTSYTNNPCRKNVRWVLSNVYPSNVMGYAVQWGKGEDLSFFSFPESPDIVRMAATTDFLVAWTKNGLYRTNQTHVELSAQSLEGLDSLKTSDACDPLYYTHPDLPALNYLNLVVLYASNLVGNQLSFYYSNNGLKFTLFKASVSEFVELLDLVVDTVRQKVVCLVRRTNDAGFYLADIEKGRVDEGALTLPKTLSSLKLSNTAMGQIVAWGSVLMLSPNGGKSIFSVTINNLNGATGLSAGEFFTQCTSGNDGRFALLSSLNRVFMGHVSLNHVYEIRSGIPTTATVTLDLVHQHDLQITLLDYKKSTSWTVSLLMEAQSQWSCPYFSFESSNERTYLLDKGDSQSLNTSVVPNSDSVTGISMTESNTSVTDIDAKLSSNVFYNPAVHLIVTSQANFLNVSAESKTGRNDVTIGLEKVNLACPELSKTSSFYVGCSGNTQVKIMSSQSCDGMPNMTFVNPTTKKTFRYSCVTHGPIQNVYYSSSFAPNLGLYVNGKFKTAVTGDVAMYEVTDASSFSYRLNHARAGCTRQAQAWGDFESPDMWTMNTYRPCWGGKGAHNPNAPYIIMNSTNGNGLIWGQYIEGYYFFQVTVLDPQLSFCNLSTIVAVKVYGAPLSLGVQTAIVFGLVAILVGCLVNSYFLLRKNLAKIRAEAKVKKNIAQSISVCSDTMSESCDFSPTVTRAIDDLIPGRRASVPMARQEIRPSAPPPSHLTKANPVHNYRSAAVMRRCIQEKLFELQRQILNPNGECPTMVRSEMFMMMDIKSLEAMLHELECIAPVGR